MIPQGIKSEHILKAIEEADRSGIPRDRSSVAIRSSICLLVNSVVNFSLLNL
jgi:hypothetical protein